MQHSETPAEFLAYQTSQVLELQRPGRDAPRRVALRWGADLVCDTTRKSLTADSACRREGDAIVIHPHALLLDAATPLVMSAAGDGCCGKR
jgi:hypothetical protein